MFKRIIHIKMVNMKFCKEKKLKVILVPYPAQGHVTPMLKLASAILNDGLIKEAVLVTPEFIHNRVISSIDSKNKIRCMSIPDGLEKDAPRDFFAIENAMENFMPAHLEKLIGNIVDEDDDGRVVCVVVDLVASWAIQVADRCGLPVAGFWPAMLATYCLIAAIPDMVQAGYICDDTGCPQVQEKAHLLPNQPMLSTEDLPWLIGTPSARKSRFKFWTRTLDRLRKLRWLLVNSFPEEYIDIKKQYQLNGSHQQPLVYLVGPLSHHAITKNPSFWEEDMSCIEWLDKQKPNSVVYISFGSWVSPIGEAKVKSLAMALEASGLNFIWVLGLAWQEGLPNGFLERTTKSLKGKVVSWAPQMKVLRHEAVGCYLTHCGWNSTMEAIECRKRLLCWPVAGDQFVNCAYIVKIWKIGVKINGFGRKDIEEGLKRVMMEENVEMNNRLMKLHKRTMEEDARSRVMANLIAFVDDLNNKITNSSQNQKKRMKDVQYQYLY
ncbi:hypothetical protein Patl1_33280 [Pistacia atlantica]|uniref:Uncharacterized protein n=1 Tax=Pistacia atlantica TaxID=434234 RepID=A0ACC1AQQ1_9ROSI|nr:hypothetical protein Patl1_33280 [Pistacia atlantica]